MIGSRHPNHPSISVAEQACWFGFFVFVFVWFGLVWFGLVWFGLVWFGVLFFVFLAAFWNHPGMAICTLTEFMDFRTSVDNCFGLLLFRLR